MSLELSRRIRMLLADRSLAILANSQFSYNILEETLVEAARIGAEHDQTERERQVGRAILDEREACAAALEATWIDGRTVCAKVIRARGDK